MNLRNMGRSRIQSGLKLAQDSQEHENTNAEQQIDGTHFQIIQDDMKKSKVRENYQDKKFNKMGSPLPPNKNDDDEEEDDPTVPKKSMLENDTLIYKTFQKAMNFG